MAFSGGTLEQQDPKRARRSEADENRRHTSDTASPTEALLSTAKAAVRDEVEQSGYQPVASIDPARNAPGHEERHGEESVLVADTVEDSARQHDEPSTSKAGVIVTQTKPNYRAPPTGVPASALSQGEGSLRDSLGGVEVDLNAVQSSTKCPICLGIIKRCRTVKVCLHRFCADCIEQALRVTSHECPACRAHMPSRRSLHADARFDALITAIYGDVEEFEACEEQQMTVDAEQYRTRFMDENMERLRGQEQVAALKKRMSVRWQAPPAQSHK